MENAEHTSANIAARKRGGGARHVFETLRDEILELKLAPGMAMDETALAARFAMSRSPIREALIRLSAVGLVQMLPNRSTIVTPLDIAVLPRFVEAIDYLQRATARLAARHRSDGDVAAMAAAVDTYDGLCPRRCPGARGRGRRGNKARLPHASGGRPRGRCGKTACFPAARHISSRPKAQSRGRARPAGSAGSRGPGPFRRWRWCHPVSPPARGHRWKTSDSGRPVAPPRHRPTAAGSGR